MLGRLLWTSATAGDGRRVVAGLGTAGEAGRARPVQIGP